MALDCYVLFPNFRKQQSRYGKANFNPLAPILHIMLQFLIVDNDCSWTAAALYFGLEIEIWNLTGLQEIWTQKKPKTSSF